MVGVCFLIGLSLKRVWMSWGRWGLLRIGMRRRKCGLEDLWVDPVETEARRWKGMGLIEVQSG